MVEWNQRPDRQRGNFPKELWYVYLFYLRSFAKNTPTQTLTKFQPIVRVENFPSTLAANPSAPPPQYNEKNPYSTPQPQYSGGYPGQPVYNQQQPAQNPYNNSVPPMAVANDSSGQAADPENGKGKMYAKKFGGKLGNAAIFGAGATIGGNIVNSIF